MTTLALVLATAAVPCSWGLDVARSCSKEWGQCGGQAWRGSTCCEPGTYCKPTSRSYSHCVKGSAPTPAPTPMPAPEDCRGLCGREDLGKVGLGCSHRNGDAQACGRSFVTRLGLHFPCRYAACGGECVSDAETAMNCTGLRDLCRGPAPPAPSATPAPASWDGANMKMTHYWDCNGQGCDAGTLQPWNLSRYVAPPGYGPQDPADFGGALYGERMWLTGAASDALSAIMGPDDGCCGGDPNDGGVGGCGKCVLVQNPHSLHPDWTAVVMKKNRCPPHSNGCGANQPHFDVAAPGFDNLRWSTANVCGLRSGTGFASQNQSATLGGWYHQCANTAECARLCDQLPSAFQRGCKLFASWGWLKGDPMGVKFRAVQCPPEFVRHVGTLFGASGPVAR